MLSNRKIELEQSLLPRFPKVLTDIVVDYCGNDSIEYGLQTFIAKCEHEAKTINSTDNASLLQFPKEARIYQFLIALALLEAYQKNTDNLENLKYLINAAYKLNFHYLETLPSKKYIISSSDLEGRKYLFLERPLSEEKCEDSIPKTFKKTTKLLFFKCKITVNDEFHGLLKDLYVECGGSVQQMPRHK